MSTVSTVIYRRSVWHDESKLTTRKGSSYKTSPRADPAHSESEWSSPRRGAPVEMQIRAASDHEVLDSHRSGRFFAIIHETKGKDSCYKG